MVASVGGHKISTITIFSIISLNGWHRWDTTPFYYNDGSGEITPVLTTMVAAVRIQPPHHYNTDHSCLFLRQFLPNITKHPLRPRISFSEFNVYSLKLIFPIVLKTLMSIRFEYYGIRIVSGVT
jgi:hypothetical protein